MVRGLRLRLPVAGTNSGGHRQTQILNNRAPDGKGRARERGSRGGVHSMRWHGSEIGRDFVSCRSNYRLNPPVGSVATAAEGATVAPVPSAG